MTKNIQVPRHVVAELMREMDQEGCEQRTESLKRSYFSSGLNYTWHVDGQIKTLWISQCTSVSIAGVEKYMCCG